MNKSFRTSVFGLIFGAAIVSGCAKQELVKKDEPVPPAAPAVQAKPPVAPVPAKTVTAPPVKEENAAQGQKAAAGNATQAAALDRIYFDFNSYSLTPAARDILVKNAQLMKRQAGVKVRVEGNCDERGSDEYNLALGEKRAKEAVKYLVTMGVKADRLSVISYGKEKPAVAGHDESAWAKNRRDEFVIVSK